MRKIKFRGVDMVSNEWVYGDCLHLNHEYTAIVTDYNGNRKVIFNDSLGQATDFVDVNGTEIYEGDLIEVIQINNPGEIEVKPVRFSNGRFGVGDTLLDLDFYCDYDNVMQCRVVGNTYSGLFKEN